MSSTSTPTGRGPPLGPPPSATIGIPFTTPRAPTTRATEALSKQDVWEKVLVRVLGWDDTNDIFKALTQMDVTSMYWLRTLTNQEIDAMQYTDSDSNATVDVPFMEKKMLKLFNKYIRYVVSQKTDKKMSKANWMARVMSA